MKTSTNNNVKKYKCERCQRPFARHEHLQRHERSHTKEKPYVCPVCNQAFTRSDLLVRHNRLVHLSGNKSSRRGIKSEPQHVEASQPPIPTIQTHPPNDFSYPEPPLSLENGLDLPHMQGPIAPLQHESFLDPALGDDSSFLPMLTGDYFSTFLDSVDSPAHLFSSAFQFDSSDSTSNSFPEDSERALEYSAAETLQSFSRYGSRLPSLQPEEPRDRPPHRNQSPRKAASEVTIAARDLLARKLRLYEPLFAKPFQLPSRHALTRYISAYFTGFHEHLPFLHVPTFTPERASLDLVLAIAAVGAQYCREPDKSIDIFQVAKTVAVESVRKRDTSSLFQHSDSLGSLQSPRETEVSSSGFSGRSDSVSTSVSGRLPSLPGEKRIETVQALLLLMAMATWFEHKPLAREALAIRSLLDFLIREDGMELRDYPTEVSWEDWVEREMVKRTRFIVFAFSNLHLIVFDIPPLICTANVFMDLPCPENEWKAKDVTEWQAARQFRRPSIDFQTAYNSLFQQSDPQPPHFTSLGCYVLIHALIQQIWLLRQLFRNQPGNFSATLDESPALPLPELTTMENALKTWQKCWSSDPESSVDPLSPHGPLSFNSSALLRLAYIRLNVDTGPMRALGSWDPVRIARSISSRPPLPRSKRMTRAALHCAHALSIPIKLGINFVAHTQMFFWSTQHALCALECALLLTKWLETVTAVYLQPSDQQRLCAEETKLLGFICEMVSETEYSAPPPELLRDNKHLSAIVVRLWAKLFRSDSIWQMVDVIGKSLLTYADMLEQS